MFKQIKNKHKKLFFFGSLSGFLYYKYNSTKEYQLYVNQTIKTLHNKYFNYIHHQRKKVLFKDISNCNIFDINVENGKNLKYLTNHNITYHGLILNYHPVYNIKDELVHTTSDAGYPHQVLHLTNIPHDIDVLTHLKENVANNSQDIILATHLLDSNDNNDLNHHLVKEIYNKLKPGGRYYFIEYTKSNSTTSFVLQSLFNPIYKHLANISLINDCGQAIIKSGFSHLYIESWPNDHIKQDDEHIRRDIKRIGVNREKATLHGLDDSIFKIKHIIAGIGVKK